MDTKADNLYIRIAYKLYTHEGNEPETLWEEIPEQAPLIFISGLGCMLPEFENALCDMKDGQQFNLSIPVASAFGEVDDEQILDLPRSSFERDGHLDTNAVKEGAVVPLLDEAGRRFHATVLEVTDTSVTVDLNHPLAGQNLRFEGKMLEKRVATSDELTMMVRMLAGEGGCCGGQCGGQCEENGCGGCGNECGNCNS